MEHSRRNFLARTSLGVGTAALHTLLSRENASAAIDGIQAIAPKAKRVIYLFQSGGPSHLDLYDYKPHLVDRFGENLPDSVRGGQRLTGFTKNQKSLPVTPTRFQFERCDQIAPGNLIGRLRQSSRLLERCDPGQPPPMPVDWMCKSIGRR